MMGLLRVGVSTRKWTDSRQRKCRQVVERERERERCRWWWWKSRYLAGTVVGTGREVQHRKLSGAEDRARPLTAAAEQRTNGWMDGVDVMWMPPASLLPFRLLRASQSVLLGGVLCAVCVSDE
jgi:hypothetical protein